MILIPQISGYANDDLRLNLSCDLQNTLSYHTSPYLSEIMWESGDVAACVCHNAEFENASETTGLHNVELTLGIYAVSLVSEPLPSSSDPFGKSSCGVQAMAVRA